jgi:hypothetical protein
MILPVAASLSRGTVPHVAQGFKAVSRHPLLSIVALLCCAVLAVSLTEAAGTDSDALLPPECPEGWAREGHVRHYTKDNLYEYINGEAEIFFPFGFEDLATAAYREQSDSPVAIVADLYRMGSVLSAFGIYSNYRNPDDSVVPAGAEGSLNPAQLLFYQNRFFVRLSASGASELSGKTFIACAKAISFRLPGPPAAPRELALFPPGGILAGTEKYSAASLFGYPFFRAGLTAEVNIGGQTAKAFVVIEDSFEKARKALDNYDSYLKQSGRSSGLSPTEDSDALAASDPLYSQVVLIQKGPHIFGLARLADAAAGLRFLRAWAAQLHRP